MPKHNILYRFISKTLELAQENGLKFSAKVNYNKTPYYLLDLPINPNATLILGDRTYKLEEQHVSIYEPMIDKSQYHYTATLSTNEGKKYRLHVYFNEKDKLCNKPYLDSVSNTERMEVHLTEAQQDMLIDQALEECQPPILALRRQHGKFIAELDKRYTQSVAKLEALSKNLRQNYAAYVRESEATKQILAELCLYHSGQEYKNILRLINRTVPLLKPEPKQITTVAHKPATENVQNSNLVSQPEVSVTSVTIITETKQKKLSQPQEPSIQKQSLASHIEILETAWTAFLEVYRLESLNSVKQFLSFNTELNSTCIGEMEGKLDCSPSAIERLEFMMMVRTEYAKKLLTELLLKHEFEKAESLKGFVPLLEKRLLNISLITGNAKLLDFLLTHGDFALNTHEIVDGLAPVPFCLAKCGRETPMAPCLEILIQHGATLMVRYQGLPAAYHILAVTDHPLRSALINKAKETIASKEFLAMLIRECERALTQGKDEFINKQKILQFIIKVQNDLNALSVSGKNAVQQAQNTEKALKALTEKIGRQLSEELHNNPRILECKEQYYNALKEYKKTASAGEYRALLKESNEVIADSIQIIKILGKSDFVKMNLLNETVNFLQRATRLIELKTELNLINAEIKKPKTKQNSRGKQLVAEAQQLAEQIRTLSKEHYQSILTTGKLVDFNRELKGAVSDAQETLARADNMLKRIDQTTHVPPALPENTKPNTPTNTVRIIVTQAPNVPQVSPENTTPNTPTNVINDIPPEKIKKVDEEIKEKVDNWLCGSMM